MREKKFRTFLIVFSVMLSAALFLASVALSGTLEKTFMERFKKEIGTADLVIHANEKTPYWMFHLSKTAVVKDQLEYAVGSVESSGLYKAGKESTTIRLKGFYLEDLARFNPYVLAEQQDLQPFEGHKIILSQKTARKYRLSSGASIDLKIKESRYRFKIVAIAQPTGLFQDDGQSDTAVVPREFLARIFYAPGRVSQAYLKLKDRGQLEAVTQRLSEEYRRYTVREPITRAELQQYTQAVAIPFFIMLVLVLFISIFIIYSSFKVITRERLPVIGTFRSIGATRKTTDLVLFAESLCYGVAGGITGCGLGLAILYFMAMQMRPEWFKAVPVSLTYSPFHLLSAFLLAVILPLGSSFFPIVKVSKLPVKAIIFNAIESSQKKRSLRLILGLGFLALVLVAPRLVPQQIALAVDVSCMLLAVIAMVLLVPYLTNGFLKVFEVLYEGVLGNEGVLAAKNLRHNKSIINNISLLAIGISSLLMINTISFSVVKEIANFYKDAQFDIWMWSHRADRKYAGVVGSIEGVSGVLGVYTAQGTEIDGTKERIELIHGINSDTYFDFWNVPLSRDKTALLQELDLGRNIMLSQILKEKLGVREGDILQLKMKRGKRPYKVVGFFSSLMWGGNFAMVSQRYLKLDMQLQNYANLFIKTSQSPEQVVQRIKARMARDYPWVETVSNMNRQELQQNQQMFQLLQGFSVLTLIIGLFGVFNNLMISFIERKRSLAMMRSVGMSKRQTLKIILIESLTGGVIGGSVGILGGTMLIGLIPFVMRAINQVVPVNYSPKEYVIAFLFGVVITVVASIGPALKSSRFNIIEAIKYE